MPYTITIISHAIANEHCTMNLECQEIKAFLLIFLGAESKVSCDIIFCMRATMNWHSAGRMAEATVSTHDSGLLMIECEQNDSQTAVLRSVAEFQSTTSSPLSIPHRFCCRYTYLNGKLNRLHHIRNNVRKVSMVYTCEIKREKTLILCLIGNIYFSASLQFQR